MATSGQNGTSPVSNGGVNGQEVGAGIKPDSNPVKKKLFGREFYRSIGSPKMILAPMVDRSEFAWRMLTREFMDKDSTNPLLAYSPMFHARLFNERSKYREQHFEPTRPITVGDATSKERKPHLDGNPATDRPLIVQFCANEPDDLLQAAKHVQDHCDAVDLNLGCPQGIARKGHYGSFLQEDPDRIFKLINNLHKNLSIPVTAKFRILETKEKTLEYAKMILSAGASIITVHGRRREQKGHNTGLADWSYIRYLRDNLPPETVIFANGNILSHDDFKECLEATGADGVMSAEGNLSDPTIFASPPPVGQEGSKYWRGRDGKGGYRLDYIVRAYLDVIYKHVLERPPPHRTALFNPYGPESDTEVEDLYNTSNVKNEVGNDPTIIEHDDAPPKKKRKKGKSNSPNLCAVQGHMFQLLRHLITRHTHIRDALAECGVGSWAQFEKVATLVEKEVKKDMREYQAYTNWYEEAARMELESIKSPAARATIAKYKRPWWVCQPFIRPLPEEALENGALSLKKKDRVKEDVDRDEGKGGKEKEAGKENESARDGDGDTQGPATEVVTGVGNDRKIIITPDPLVSG